ncbi:hypothetical protein Tco_0658907 [Tanacetum coccineum]
MNTKRSFEDYWKWCDEIEVSDNESSDLDEYWSDKEETAKKFKIETDAFEYETPLCLITKMIRIYEWNEMTMVYDKPWLDNGIWNWREDGYCNGGNLPGAYHIGNSLHYQDLECMSSRNREIKITLRNKAIMEGLISNDESSNDCWKR